MHLSSGCHDAVIFLSSGRVMLPAEHKMRFFAHGAHNDQHPQ
ncbi:Glycerol-3-phosphate ABC transporter, periplasmic glycerol-3-phosphate-binding protein [Dickeya solani RNS 08.23.3.1.A]|nr:Glycerol-3-phosphate ABC transporter, periplasmic glycerol-3-phosphate-binding protein [Dickeya solani RNS 08.23.3.1.A]